MEKLEKEKETAQKELQILEVNDGRAQEVASLKTYEELLRRLRTLAEQPDLKSRIIQALVHKITVTLDGLKIHFDLLSQNKKSKRPLE